MRILAVSLDLDDTLWPIEPAILAAERHLDDWLKRHHAAVAEAWPIAALRDLREQVSAERPDLSHDFTTQRLLTLERAFAACGIGNEHVDAAFEVYYAARNRVDCYPDALPALAALSARLPLVSISNGNADLERIGLRQHFRHSISARELGVAKPAAAIFHEACARLGVAPENVLHVGDDPLLDVIGAHAAGLHTAWLNRHAATWAERVAQYPAHADATPDLEIRDLGELARWIEDQGKTK
ncbi:HAD family hydrolase [Dokdonella soli]|uniref:HAD family hydrolase n=1 Tax=Dokdonella soli TaxID=529810 RepID=A0ABN1IKT8_9GAMM